MLPQTVKVGAGRTSVDVVLSEDMIGLEDVVVTGYTTMKRKDITGSVSSISADRIERIPAYNITTALTGIAGIRMDGGSIRIRGTRSRNASNDPLIVLDGIPYDETLSSINPGDIESIDVLKDASSTAIYGARGANGVILITTKQARQGKTTVTYDGFVGAGVNNRGSLDVMDADEYIAFQREASRAAGTWHSEADDAKAFFGIELANMGKVDNDWMGKYFNKKRLWTSHSLTISAATDKSAYKIAFNYKNEDSRYKNAGHDHFYLTADLSHKVLPFLKVGLSSRAYYIVKNDKPDMFNQFLHMSPLTQTRNEDGSYNVYPFGDPFVKNPYMNESDDVYKDKTEEWKLFLRFFAQIDLAKGLTFNTNFAYSPAFSSRGYYYDNRSVSYTDERNVAFMHNNRKADWVWNNVLSYKRQFDRHNIDLTAVYEMQNRQTVNASMSGKDQESPAYLWYNMGRLTDSKSLSSGFVRSQMVSVVGRVQYSYDDRYIVTASFREDGASQLSPGHKWAFFPSGAIAWRISEEPFLKDVEWISNLKLRASYGALGNSNVDPYTYLETFGLSTFGTGSGDAARYLFGQAKLRYTSLPGQIPDNIGWETSKTFDVGLDAGFLNGRLNLTADYYIRKTVDMYTVGPTLPDTFGATAPKGNYADMSTYGYEIALSYNDSFKLAGKPFNFGIKATLADYYSIIDRYNNASRKLSDYYEGQRLGEIWGFVCNGLFQSQAEIDAAFGGKGYKNDIMQTSEKYITYPGDMRFEDLTGNDAIDRGSSTVDDPGDRKIIGNSEPRYLYTISLNADWNGFFLSALFDGVGRQQWFPSDESLFWGMYNRPYNQVPTWHLQNYWTEERPNAYLPRYVGYYGPMNANTVNVNTRYLQDVSYIRLKNLQFGYELPKRWISKIGLSKVSVYFSGENLWSWSPLYRHTKDFDVTVASKKSDSDISNSKGDGHNYPVMRSFSFGISITY